MVVPPHILDVLAASEDSKTRQLALKTSIHSSHVRARRKHHFDTKNNAGGRTSYHPTPQGIVPDQILETVTGSEQTDGSSRDIAQRTLDVNQKLQDESQESPTVATVTSGLNFHRQIHDMQNLVRKDSKSDETYQLLPGKLVRSEGEPPIVDEHANQAYDNCGTVLDFYRQVFDYALLDDQAVPIISSIHFETGYQNAQWLGDSARQMVYGDGGHILYNFTACLDVIGHEITHAVTEQVCSLYYDGESGALNEHISDVFGMMITLWAEKKTSAESDWLIGEGCLMPGVKGVALRNMKFPGTAYDDQQFGKDPQPASWADIEAYKVKHKYWASYDHGSVHAFSGVPNRAFVLASEALGGYCWEKAGRIWWLTLKTHRIPSTCSFIQFANATVDVARESFGEEVAKTVRNAWDVVGVKKPTSSTDTL